MRAYHCDTVSGRGFRFEFALSVDEAYGRGQRNNACSTWKYSQSFHVRSWISDVAAEQDFLPPGLIDLSLLQSRN